eukprot:scaffold978_cov118-Isochrysis_galbana.AAC.4
MPGGLSDPPSPRNSIWAAHSAPSRRSRQLPPVSGVKHLMLFPPSDAPLLDYAARRKGQLRYTWPGNFTRASVSEHRVLFASSVNLTEPDEARHGAALRLARPLRCEIRGGETLYLPAWWHHEVRSAGAPAGEINLAVNFWFRNETGPPDGM